MKILDNKQKIELLIKSDKDYWNYLYENGSKDEKITGSDYFDVLIDAFNYDYDTFRE